MNSSILPFREISSADGEEIGKMAGNRVNLNTLLCESHLFFCKMATTLSFKYVRLLKIFSKFVDSLL